MTTHYSCLFTKHKTQKRKTWHDGKLTVQPSGRVTLEKISFQIVNSDVNCSLDAIDIHLSGIAAIKNGNLSELEFEKHLVTIEGPYHAPAENPTHSITPRVGRVCPNDARKDTFQTRQNASNGMKKLMSKKFQVPSKFIPSHPSQKENIRTIVSRKRPLQPGELVRKHYGHPNVGLQPTHAAPPAGYSMPPQYSGTNQNRQHYQNSSLQPSQQQAMNSNRQSHGQLENPTPCARMNTGGSYEPQSFPHAARNPPPPSKPSNANAPEQLSQKISTNTNTIMNSEKRLKGNFGSISTSSNSKSQLLESNEFNPSAFYDNCFDESDASQSDEEGNGNFNDRFYDGRPESNELKTSNEQRISNDPGQIKGSDDDGAENEVLSKSDLLTLFSGDKIEEAEKIESSRTNEKAKIDVGGDNNIGYLQENHSDMNEKTNAEEDEPNPFLANLLQSEAKLEEAMKRNENIENVTWKNINDDQSVYSSDNEETGFPENQDEKNRNSSNLSETNSGGKQIENILENHNDIQVDPEPNTNSDVQKMPLDEPSDQLENVTNHDTPITFTLNVGDDSSSDESSEDE